MKIKFGLFLFLIAGIAMGKLWAIDKDPTRGNLPRQAVKIPPMKFPIPKLPDLFCSQEGSVQCDAKKHRFRRCERDNKGRLWWSGWTSLTADESELADNCAAHCGEGEIICPFRDYDYRICENGEFSEFRRLSDNDESERVRSFCANPDNQHRQCWPGKARCFNDGGYNICGEEGYWSEAGDTSAQFHTFLMRCLFPRSR